MIGMCAFLAKYATRDYKRKKGSNFNGALCYVWILEILLIVLCIVFKVLRNITGYYNQYIKMED